MMDYELRMGSYGFYELQIGTNDDLGFMQKSELPELKTHQTRLIYPELSYRVVGALFDVFNDIGYGHRERIYQKAMACRLRELGIPFKEQLATPVRFHGLPAGNHYLDFLIDDKLVLELKQGRRVTRMAIDQVNDYLRSTNLRLGIIATFMPHGVTFMRILNLPDYQSIRTHM